MTPTSLNSLRAAGEMKSFEITGQADIDLTAAADGAEPKQPTFDILAYTGGQLRVSGFPHPVVVDLRGLEAKGNISALMDHDPKQLVGQGTAKIAGGQVRMTGKITGDHSVAGEPAFKVVGHAKRGFQWPVSIGASVHKLEFVGESTSVKVNGQSFQGPLYVVRAGRLGEVSFLSIGADAGASASIAASAAGNTTVQGEPNMTFEEFCKSKGVDPATMTPDERAAMMKQYEADQTPAAAAAKIEVKATTPIDVGAAVQTAIKAERERTARIEAACKLVEGSEPLKLRAMAGEIDEVALKASLDAIAEMRKARPQAFNVHTGTPPPAEPLVLQAALCMSGGLRDIEKRFTPATLEAADRHRGIGLQEVLLFAANQGGYTGRQRITAGNLRPILQAAWSTAAISGILGATANKFLMESFNYVESAWREIAAIRNVSDFKTVTSYRLTGGGGYTQLGPGGAIDHGTLAEDSFTNKALTYAEMLAITRTDIINDDLGALSAAPAKLGRDAALKLNSVFWTAFLNNSAHFASGYSNLSTGSALAIAGLTKVVTAFRKLRSTAVAPDTVGKLIGLTPAIMLVPVDLEVTALGLYRDLTVNEAATAGSPAPNGNPHVGKYRPVASAYLSDSSISGYSTTSWYLLADPRSLATIEVAFLDGQQAPTVETADADFNTLGIQMRGYHDFGVSLQDPKAGVRANA